MNDVLFSLVVIPIKKYEKEVIQYQLDSEKAMLKELEKQYKVALNSIDDKIATLLGRNDANLQNVIFQVEHQKALRRQVEGILNQLHSTEFDSISDYLATCYEDGFIGTMYSVHNQGIPMILPFDQNAATKAIITDSKINTDLYTALGVDVSKLKKSISSEITRGIAAGMSYNEIARNVTNVSKAPLSRAKTIVRTEAHRIQEASAYDAQMESKKKGANVVRQWKAVLDGNVRNSHMKLDGQTREMEEPFELGNKKAMFPGEFGDPAEDCNCRCRSITRARWALDDNELQKLKDRAAFFGLDKTKDFEEFKEKYLGAVDRMAAGAQTENDWSKATPRNVSKEEKEKLIQYAEDKGIHVVNLNDFDGDSALLKAEIDTVARMVTEFPIGKKVTVAVSNALADGDFASTTKNTITFNSKVLRNRKVTEQNILNGGFYFASANAEGISVHEYGHIFASSFGNKGLEITKKAYYNIHGKMLSDGEALSFLETAISEYAVEYSGDLERDAFKNAVKATKFKEIIPEVMAKSQTDDSEFVTEFVRLLKG